MKFNMFFTTMLHVGEKLFVADAAIMDNMVQLQRKDDKGEKKRGRHGLAKPTEGKEEEEYAHIIHCGECCTLMMQALGLDRQEAWRG